MTIADHCQVFRASSVNLPQVARVENSCSSATKGGRMKHVPSPRIARGMHVTLGIAATTLFCAGSGPISPSNAQTIGSTYTPTAPKDCHVSSAGNGVDDSMIRVCPGKAGLEVLVSEDDLREPVSVGRSQPRRRGQGAGCTGLVRSVQLDH